MSPREFDEAMKLHFDAVIAASNPEDLKGEHIVMSPIDIMGDGVTVKCSICDESGVIRPWMAESIEKYQLSVLCAECSHRLQPIEKAKKEWMKQYAKKNGAETKNKESQQPL